MHRYLLGGVGVGSVLLFLVCVLGVLVVVVVPTPEFAVFDGVFSSVDPVMFVVDFAGPGWCFASFVDAVFVSGDDCSAHGDGESGALRANIEWLRAWISDDSGDSCIAAHLSGCFAGDVLPVLKPTWPVCAPFECGQVDDHRNVGL
jgi:hypothetical protein